jgi:hypothetical protein
VNIDDDVFMTTSTMSTLASVPDTGTCISCHDNSVGKTYHLYI